QRLASPGRAWQGWSGGIPARQSPTIPIHFSERAGRPRPAAAGPFATGGFSKMKRWSLALVCLLAGVVAGSYFAGPLLYGQPQHPAPAVPKELTSYRDVVKKVLPAVVSTEATAKAKPRAKQPQPRRQPRFDDPRIPEEFRKFFEEFGGRGLPFEMPDDSPRLGFGSGFLVDPKGVVLTNWHVVDG